VIILMPHREIQTMSELIAKGYSIDTVHTRRHVLNVAVPRIPVLTNVVRLDQSMKITEVWDARRG
jgi:hypothetical protein